MWTEVFGVMILFLSLEMSGYFFCCRDKTLQQKKNLRKEALSGTNFIKTAKLITL